MCGFSLLIESTHSLRAVDICLRFGEASPKHFWYESGMILLRNLFGSLACLNPSSQHDDESSGVLNEISFSSSSYMSRATRCGQSRNQMKMQQQARQ